MNVKTLLEAQDIDPAETREQLWKSLEMYMNKSEDRPKKKHGNMPL